jgi:Tfp pilus assembly PilM family ATPase
LNMDLNKVLMDFDSKEADELREALNKILIFWFTDKNNIYQHKKIHTAYIAGDNADAPGIQEFLERHLGLNVELANVWSNCFEPSDFVPKISREDSLKYAITVGMARKAVKEM